MTQRKSFFSIGIVDKIIVAILTFFASIFGNYGLAIIATTVLVKIILLPLSIHQEKHMRKTNELKPKIDELNKKYPNKGPEYNKELAELYKTENANPFLGCLPVLIQLPVFVGLFNAFYSSQIPSTEKFLWFTLSKPDTLFMISGFAINILPIITALLQILQQKIMTMGMPESKETQTMNNMMYTMPLFMMFIFYKLPSALNLYYLINIFLSIIQSYVFLKLRQKYQREKELEKKQEQEKKKKNK